MANDLTPERLKRLEEIDKSIGAPIGWGASQLMAESSGRANAKNDEGRDIGTSLGLGQIIPKTLDAYKKKLGNKDLDPLNPDDAITLYKAMMQDNTKRFGNYRDASRAYNAGWKPSRWNNETTNKYMKNIDSYLNKYSPDNRSSNSPLQILDNAVNGRRYIDQKQSIPKDAVMSKDTNQFIIDMNNFADNPNYTKPLTFDSYKEEVDKYLPPKQQPPSKREVVVPYSKENQFYGQANEMVNKYRNDIGKPAKETLENAIKALAYKSGKSDFAPIGRDTRGIATMMDANAAASGGSRYLEPLLGNQAFTGLTPEDQAQLLDRQEINKANMIGTASKMRSEGLDNIIKDQQFDQNYYRGLTGDNLTSLYQLAGLSNPKKSNVDSLTEGMKILSNARNTTDDQITNLDLIQKAYIKRLQQQGY